MQTLVTFIAGVVLGITIAFAAIHWGLDGPKTISIAGNFISRHRRKVVPILVLVASVALGAVVALYRAEVVKRAADDAGRRIFYFNKSARIAYLPDNLPPDWALLTAAFRRVNILRAALASIDLTDPGPFDPAHDPLDLIKDTFFESDFLFHFVAARNAGHTRAIIQQLERGQLADERLIRGGGKAALWALFLAAFLDLPTLPFGAAAYWAVRRLWPRRS